jgi:hypothetical protein
MLYLKIFNKQQNKEPSIMQRREDVTGECVRVLYIRKT